MISVPNPNLNLKFLVGYTYRSYFEKYLRCEKGNI